MQSTIINSIEEYVSFIERLPYGFTLSRGQECDKELLPSILRKDDDGMRLYSNANAKAFVDDFKINAVRYMDDIHDFNDKEWMVYAQHFGVPTFLLDFTYSHLVSLMFAVENAFDYNQEDESNSVVWFLNPEELNLQTIKQNQICNISNNDQIIDGVDKPCAITAKKRNSRMAAQNGVFVYFPINAESLDKQTFSELVLRKVIVPHASAKEILKSLYIMGMRFIDIYPELASISKDILLKNNVQEYLKEEFENE